MKILYVFPHPDDESFGPSAVMHQQLKEGHEVHLLTLTRGEATKVRYKLGYSEEQMADIRAKELESVAEFLKLSSLKIMEFEDGMLAHYDPIVLEKVIEDYIVEIAPDILVTYPVHGISGHHDHLTTHFIVKRIYIKFKQLGNSNLKRLAFLTLPRLQNGNDDSKGGNYEVNRSHDKFIDAAIKLTKEDQAVFLNSLDLYKTFQEVIKESGVKEKIGNTVYFELFGEDFKPPLKSLTELLY
jgi:LmbE family N-acetylglucosaminyl deacetylase